MYQKGKMSLTRIELCVHIPGPKLAHQPLEKIEELALKKISPELLIAVQTGEVERVIDYVGNYFLILKPTKGSL